VTWCLFLRVCVLRDGGESFGGVMGWEGGHWLGKRGTGDSEGLKLDFARPLLCVLFSSVVWILGLCASE
jgi:hypothetical protein